MKHLLLISILSVLSGCTMAKISGAGPRPILLNTPQTRFDVIKHFVVEHESKFDYTNTVEIDRAIADILSSTGADSIINVRITIKQTVSDYLCNSVTCALAQARTYEIEGDAIRWK